MNEAHIAAMTQSDYQKAAGARLRKVIQMLGMTLVEAANVMQISKHVLNHWLIGDNPIQPYALYRLCWSRKVDFNYVALGDWSRLPHELAKALEDELQSTLAGPQASERPAVETRGRRRVRVST